MATRAGTDGVHAAGLVHGVVLVTFPVASTIVTDPDEYDLLKGQHGAMFLPHVITAIARALLEAAGAFAFGRAGLGCSALLPLTISFAQGDLVAMFAATAGFVIAAYQLGYGIAAFGAGPLQDAGVTQPAIFAIAAIAAGAMAVLSFVIARPTHQVTAVHPRPA